MSAEVTDRETLEREANLVRARLSTTLDILDRRRHDMMDVKLQLRRHALPLAVGVGVLALGGMAVVGYGVYRLLGRDDQLRRERVNAATKAWRRPERIGRFESRNMLVEVGRRILVGSLAFAGIQVAKYLVVRSLPGPPNPSPPRVLPAVHRPL